MAYQELAGLGNVICGSQLTEQDLKCLKSSLVIEEDENVLRLWAYCGWKKKKKAIDISDALVGITDKAIFKFEKYKLTRILLSTVNYASHNMLRIFEWDKIRLHLKNGTTEEVGIFHKSSCAHFVDFINRMVKMEMNK